MHEDKPLTIVIFGATGDLAQNKLIPALFDLYKKDRLPTDFKVVGFSRKSMSRDEYRLFMKETLQKYGDTTGPSLSRFLEKGFYIKGDLTEFDTYKNLADFLEEKDKERGVCSNKIFYLAVPPRLYQKTFTNLSRSAMTMPCKKDDENKQYWTRVLVEKPFGSDPQSAEELDMLLGKLFNEDQIFRIDHYLAKETIQNILTFRFANTMFEPIWNKDEIDRVHIRLFEQSGIRDRGAFYDGIGALRDVGQNHMLQMLALIAMEEPKSMTAMDIRDARQKVLENVIPGARDFPGYVVRGQYKGYKHVEGVDQNSDTETFFKLRLGVNTKKWKGIPFYLESGKALDNSKTEIEIIFKERPNCACPKNDDRQHTNNILFRVQPNEGITIRFWAKRPGFDFDLDKHNLSFDYADHHDGLPDAYQRVLYDCIRGDQTLFAGTGEVKAEWKIVAPICANWDKVPMKYYVQGSDPEGIV